MLVASQQFCLVFNTQVLESASCHMVVVRECIGVECDITGYYLSLTKK